MKNNHIGFGVFIISIGLIWLLWNFGIVNWSIFDSLFKLWPLLLVVAGINIIFKNNGIVRAIVWVLFLATIIGYSAFYGGMTKFEEQGVPGNIFIEKLPETKEGEMTLSLGGTNLSLDGNSSQLLDASFTDTFIKHSIAYEKGNETADVKIRKTSNFERNHNNLNSDFKIHLNNSILWDMKIETGAVKGELDLSNIKVRDFKMSVGAAKMDLIFGNTYTTTNAKIDAGASSIDVTIPSNVGAKIKMSGGLNGTNLNTLGWIKDHDTYTSPNYNSAESKIDMVVNMGVGSFNVLVPNTVTL